MRRQREQVHRHGRVGEERPGARDGVRPVHQSHDATSAQRGSNSAAGLQVQSLWVAMLRVRRWVDSRTA